MLLSPLRPTFPPQHSSEEYRPSRDLESFKSLLPPPIEFIEGSSSGALAIPEGKYEPINVSPQAQRTEIRSHTPSPVKPASSTKSPLKTQSLYTGVLESSWLPKSAIGAGMHNIGNTCFLNSALQCLVHTAPLLHVLEGHGKGDECRVRDAFCMACCLREVATMAHSRRGSFTPYQITSKLQTIAKHMRRGRQEDSHEFLRYAIDALQKSCLTGHSLKLDPKLAETTWVHKIFGGRLRSRVTCRECGHNSDTFDSILDLSLDIVGVSGLKEALRKFIAVDYLKGADKYKCEKCEKAVNAEKRFTLHDAPLVLTVHLKRFSPLGRKIGHHVKYDERLGLQPFMSDGGGPNSGHYLAHVKGRDSWYEMNDEMVTPIRCAPVNLKSAYMLFYIRDKGQALEAAITSSNSFSPALTPPNVRIAMKKRPRPLGDDKEEDMGVKTNIPFIGPQLPSPTTSSPSLKPSNLTAKSSPDPQAESIKKKIEAAKGSPLALQQLSQYASDEEDEKPGEQSTAPLHIEDRIDALSPLSSSPPRTTTPSPSSSPQRPVHGIPAASFYATLPPVNGSSNGTSSGKRNKKRKVSHCDRDRDQPRRPLGQSTSSQRNQNWPPRSSVNPWGGLSGGNNLRDPFHKHTYRGRPRTIM